MVLGDAEETVTTVEIDEETYEEVYKTAKKDATSVVSANMPRRSTVSTTL